MSLNTETAYQRNKVAKLKKELLDLQKYAAILERQVEAFWSGNIKENSTLDEVVMARQGRLRLEAMEASEN